MTEMPPGPVGLTSITPKQLPLPSFRRPRRYSIFQCLPSSIANSLQSSTAMKTLRILLAILSFLPIVRLNAQTADDFNPDGNSGYFYALAVQVDGKILVGGSFTRLGEVPRNNIARLNTDGSLDTGFNLEANDEVHSLVVQADGKILVGGHFTSLGGQTRNRIARLNADGSLDTGFNPGADNIVYSLAVQTDGKILVGGYFTTLAGQTRNFVARLNPDGSLDTGFDPGSNGTVISLVLQADGKILVGGNFTSLGNQTRNRIARLNPDGSLDTGFNPGADSYITAQAVQADGKIVVGGQFTTLGGQTRNRIARLNPDGSLDTGFNAGMSSVGGPSTLALQADGKILMGSSFATFGGQPRNGIARLNADGSLDTGFNPGDDSGITVYALAVQPDGKILVGGYFFMMGGQPRNRIARLNNDIPASQTLTMTGNNQIDWMRGGSAPEVEQVTLESWNGTAWASLGAATRVTGGWRMTGLSLPTSGWIRARGRTTYDQSSGLVAQVARYGFDEFPDIAVSTAGVASFVSGASTLDFGSVIYSAPSAPPRSITITNAGSAVLSGLGVSIAGQHAADFTTSNLATTTLAPGQSATLQIGFTAQTGGLRVAELRITSNDADESPFLINLQGNLEEVEAGYNPGASSSVLAFAQQMDGKILVGGQFTTLGGQPRGRIARLNADGSLDTGFNPGASNIVNSLVVQTDGKILVGGNFTTLGGQARTRIGRLNADGSLDTAFNPGASSTVNSLVVQADGKIIVGGNFTTLGGQTRNRIARLNADGSLDASFTPEASGGNIGPLALQADGKILVGGGFTTLGGQPRNRIARINADGSLDSGFIPEANGDVISLVVQPDGKILVGGNFTTLAGQPRNRIARLNADGSLDPSFDPEASGLIYSLALQTDGRILIGGDFTTLGGQPRDRIARLNADGSLDSSFNPGAGNSVRSLALQADGKVLVGGTFTTLGGQVRNRIARLNNNTVASQALTVTGSSQSDWVRGGSAPEVEQVTFESWNGSAWVSHGAAARVAGGWRVTGLSLPASGWIRATGRATGGQYNGSAGLVVQAAGYGSGLPDIAVTGAGGTPLASGTGTLDFGTVAWPQTSPPQSITITNVGDEVLSGLAVNITGTNAADFTTGSLATTTLAPGQSTSLQVDFLAQGSGSRAAEVRITSNDADETPFVINLKGILSYTDPNFNPGSDTSGGSARSLAIQSDGKIVVGGLFNTLGGQSRTNIGRLNVDAGLDNSFNPGVNSLVSSLAVQTDGKILVGGTFSTLGGQPRNYIARLNLDGSVDGSFNPGANSSVNSLAVQTDGKILVGGAFTTLGGQPRNYIARLNADGSLDTGFSPGGGGTVLSLAVQADGKILVGGYFTTLGSQPRSYIARLNSDGSLDAGFNPGADNYVQTLAVQADSKILVGGAFTTLGGQSRSSIARLNADGSLDISFNPGAGSVESFAVQADGKILVGGNFTTLGGQSRNNIARLNADGSLDADFNPAASFTVDSLALQADGKILAGGSFIALGGQERRNIGRLNNNIAASQALTVSGTSQIDWTRGGSAPEVGQVTFESWNGSSWVSQGPATRVAGGWRASGLSLPPSTWVRARGRATGGRFNGSSGLIEQVAAYGTGVLPDIAVVDEAANALTSEADTISITSSAIGLPETHTFTIRNTGAAALENLAASVNGRDAARFSLGTLGATSLPPGGETTLTVTFTPDSANAARAFLEITSNDLDETPFVVNLGGALAPEIAVEHPPGTDLGSGSESNFGVVTLGNPLARTFTIRNSGAVALDLGTITVTGTHASDFALDLTGTASSVASGGQTTLQVTFTPSAGGARNAVLTIPNNDPDENPFVLNLSGTGNTPPVFSGYSVSTAYQTAVTISPGKLLIAASDADGHALSVTAAGPASAQGGTAVLGTGILYTPPAAFSGTDTFPVTITDALGATVNGTVTVTVGAPPGSGGSTLNPPQVTVQPNGKPKIAFQGIPGRTYRVERTTNFSTWTTLANVTASPTGQVEYTDENPPPGSAFYRIAR
jgi:uncharacterized delta-60 repeat protein